MVISQEMRENKMDNRVSKSDTVTILSVKEQRVDDSYCKMNNNITQKVWLF